MKSTEHWLVHDHTELELVLRECHNAADISDWWAVEPFFTKLVTQLRYHMAQEEEVLFPAYDAKCEPSHMQTQELYNEHSEIIVSFRKLDKYIIYRDSDKTLDFIVALELSMLEHNKKEEKVFLPFASHLLFDDGNGLCTFWRESIF
jgi:hemerythrin-like domain-containing protein